MCLALGGATLGKAELQDNSGGRAAHLIVHHARVVYGGVYPVPVRIAVWKDTLPLHGQRSSIFSPAPSYLGDRLL